MSAAAFADGPVDGALYKTVSESDIEAMTAENCVGMTSSGDGICMGSGQIWLRDIAFDGIEQVDEPALCIIAVSGLAD